MHINSFVRQILQKNVKHNLKLKFKFSCSFTSENFPHVGLEENYCRNPNGNENGPWCFTTDPATRLDYCSISECEVECMQCNGEDYHGKVSRIESGIECQHWDAQEPHMHGYTLENFPEKDLKMNFCHNPDGELQPWCFTTSPTKLWEYCDVSCCRVLLKIIVGTQMVRRGPGAIPTATQHNGSIVAFLSVHRQHHKSLVMICQGSLQVQRNAIKREAWITMEQLLLLPWERNAKLGIQCCHIVTIERDLRENYCQNLDNDISPWCYTTVPTVRWEYCNLQKCDYGGHLVSPELPYSTLEPGTDMTVLDMTECITGGGKRLSWCSQEN
ncbi:plasminogen-like [Dromaius novaehollandiae]|uniref:plasminogen-like n=1 Tax=Dromaius novaehollandiae TaxID=8790 RepID=UPI0031203822